jgi:DNA-binding HxlR family transcriptional regulator
VQRAIICGVATRLKKLEVDGLVKRRAYNNRPLRYEYHLTNKGRAAGAARLGRDLEQVA